MLPLLPRDQPQAGCAALMLHSHLSCLPNVAENQTGSLKSAQSVGVVSCCRISRWSSEPQG